MLKVFHNTFVKLYEQYQGDETAKRLLDWLVKAWEKYEFIYLKYKDYYIKRKQFINQLLELYPDLIVQGEAFNGSRTTEVRAKDYPFFVDYAPILHYKKLPNEIIIEIDRLDKTHLKLVVDRLKELDIHALVCFSGHKSFHIHFLTYPESINSIEGYRNYANAEGVKEFTDALYRVILRKTKLDSIDTGVQLYGAHWIRAVYSFNRSKDTGKIFGVKKPINGLKTYPIWYIPKNIYLEVELEKKLIEKEKAEQAKRFAKIIQSAKTSKRFEWIEKVLKNPDKVVDGRERLLWLAIAPYLYNIKGLPEEEVHRICEEWIKATGVKYNACYRGRVNYVIRLAKGGVENKQGLEIKLVPISWQNLIMKWPDDFKWLKELLSREGD